MKHPAPHIILINPWITDFSAYNFWIKPLGLLRIASLLRKNGFHITLIDCLDFFVKRKKYEDGKFLKTKIDKPHPLRSIPRNYSQYGIPEEMLLKRFANLEEKPDVIGITSGMTYWYPGIYKVIEITRKLFKNIPMILGGIYATLCYEHAKKHSNVDIVFNGSEKFEVLKLVCDLVGFEVKPNAERRTVNSQYPAFDIYPKLDYICVATSKGCPFKCTYCASPFLANGFSRRDPLGVVDEIEYWTRKHGVNNIVFYDDALLIESSNHFIPMAKELIKRGISCNFHTPNAIHIKEIDEEMALLLFRCGFKTIRLGFETSNKATQIETGGKVDNHEFRQAIKNLKRAGYSSEEIGVYLMVGMPGQRVGEVEEDIAFVKETGANPMLVEYSPIPHTPLFEKAKNMSQFDLENEPLFHNNSILPCQWDGFTMADYRRLKEGLRAK
ncbi:MAG TPA: B12-binding domain-containing radical SAM protein [Thermodesulfobacteriota bacterium]|nr:B12-binding domain-containing radical SAM protein [Thermodesulfobacteriota bacterium]